MEGDSDGGAKRGMLPAWSNLPDGPLQTIAGKIIAICDYIRFRSVCQRWRSAVDPSAFTRPQPPLLLVEHDANREDGATFFSLSTRRLHRPSVPELLGKRILASAHGWLVILDAQSKALSLLNPISRSQIALPPTSEFREFDDDDFNWVPFISSSPSASGICVVMLLGCYDERKLAAFCRVGEVSWNKLNTGLPEIPSSIAYYDEKFYVVDLIGNFSYCRAAKPDQPVQFSDSLELSGERESIYLGVIDGEFYYFGLEYDFSEVDLFMAFVRVCKADPSKPLEMSEVHGLGGKALFYSVNQLFSVNIEGFVGWRKDCVYFPYPLEWGPQVEEGDGISIIDLKDEEYDFMTWQEINIPMQRRWLSRWLTPSLC